MKYSERLSLVIIREDGRRQSWRLRRVWLHALLGSLLLLPCLVGALGWFCYDAWRENRLMHDELLRLENEGEAMEGKLERLEQVSILLEESAVPGHDILTRALAQSDMDDTVASPAEESAATTAPGGEEAAMKEQMTRQEGPGHAEFPAITSDYVSVDKVRVRLVRNRMLRIALDLRNTRDGRAEGEVTAILVTPEGKHMPLKFSPSDVGKFSILRFKRAVMSAGLPKGMDSAPNGAQVLLEVRDNSVKRTVVFRNIFAVEQ